MPFANFPTPWGCLAVLIVALVAGCRTPAKDCRVQQPLESASAAAPADIDRHSPPLVEQVAFDTSDESPPDPDLASDSEDPFGQAVLTSDMVVEAVLARSPSLEAVDLAWRAAAQRYPQVIALDDPMFGYAVGPAAWGSGEVDDGYMLELSQSIPWPGKRQLRGRAARAEASAASRDADDVRLALTQAAQWAFLEYYLAVRTLELNAENLRAVQGFVETARDKYRESQVEQQDVFAADLEVAELERRQFELERMRRVAVARLNTLILRSPDHPLPEPPHDLAQTEPAPDVELLRNFARARRPDLAALEARIRADRAAFALAYRDFYPDFEVFARYDAFWQPAERDLRPQVGMNLNLPIRQDRRTAALREASLRLQIRRAEYDSRLAEVDNDVQSAWERLTESHSVAQLHAMRIVPLAEENVEAARSGYVEGTVDILRLIDAERRLISVREKRVEAEVDYYRRLAELERAVGGPVDVLDPSDN
jgi:outer membrane protein TolC